MLKIDCRKNRFKKFVIIVSGFIQFIFTNQIYSQNIDWDKVSYGVSGQTLLLTGDFKENWKNSFGPGIILKYSIKPSLYIEGQMAFASISRKNKDDKTIPDIYLINMPLGLKWYFLNINQTRIFIYSGIENNTFVFRGDAAAIQRDNKIESEFGAFVSAGINPGFAIKPSLEFYSAFQTIFSYPENINVYFIGINVYFNE